MKTLWQLIRATFIAWNADKAPRLAAALAFYTMFTLAPLLILVIAIAGLVFGSAATRGQIIGQIQGLVGLASAQAAEAFLRQVSTPKSGIIATMLGLATLLLGVWWVFGELQDALNTIWKVAPRPERRMLDVLKIRLVSFTMMLGVGFFLLVSLIMSAALSAFGTFLIGRLPAVAATVQLMNFAVSFGIITLLFALIYKIVPDVIIAWGDVWMGATVTALLYTVGIYLIGVYLGTSSTASAYGAAGSLVVILIWIYYSAQILFLGAEFTYVYAQRHGSRNIPEVIAEPVTDAARAQPDVAAVSQVAAIHLAPPLDARRAHTRFRWRGYPFDRYAAGILGFIVGIIVSVAYGATRRSAPASVHAHRRQCVLTQPDAHGSATRAKRPYWTCSCVRSCQAATALRRGSERHRETARAAPVKECMGTRFLRVLSIAAALQSTG